MNFHAARVVSIGVVFGALVTAMGCGSAPSEDGFSDPNGGTGGGGGGSGDLGGTAGSATGSCTPVGSTQVCCDTGTQTCVGNEFGSWGPCLDAQGKTLVCGGAGSGGGGAEDGGGGSGGGGAEDGGGGSGGGGAEDGGGGNGGGGNEPPPPPSCISTVASIEPGMLAASTPAAGGSVARTGQIKLWINDEWPTIIAPGEQTDATGKITVPGNRGAMAVDGFPWEPALYINGKGYYPSAVKGCFNSKSTAQTMNCGQVAPIDVMPAGTFAVLPFTTEVIWDVSSLGLAPGSYSAEFSVHDGDFERAVGCINIGID
jgi:hypothetical protein